MRYRYSLFAFCFACVAVFGFAVVGCGSDVTASDYAQIVRGGIKTLPWPNQIKSLGGDGELTHNITGFGGSSGREKWQSHAIIWGRYQLDMEAGIEIDYKQHKVRGPTSPPVFSLHKIQSVKLTNGSWHVRYNGQWNLTDEQWKKLLQAKGDWSVVNIAVETNSPIPGIKDYIAFDQAEYQARLR